ncbi:hypothetical protein AKJ09_05680 [Labilithrix luteola]|uniref:Uncharacterized protein n=1 Tax=Labilithrix luteola TaxID=1391654 RepID=A0A0K1Q049_9BACT|nr:AgmX/PglI C-terminal domain-containing protein [Labilithrix luteola]AKU99016.1 hypothetical protein AKJ09_05680 [Labilithrix luteola]
MKALLPFTGLLLLSAVGCGGSTPPPKVEEPAHEETATTRPASTPQVAQELGSIDQRAVEQTFNRLQDRIETCHKEGRDRVEYLTGDVKVFLRVDGNGRVRYGYFEETTVGDRASEKCILDVFRSAQWPKPEGGEAEVRYGFGWGPGGEREPTSWGPEKVVVPLDASKSIKKDVDKCRAGGKGDYRLTAYVVEDGVATNDGSEDRNAKPNGKGGKPTPKQSNKQHKADGGGKFQALGIATSTKEAAAQADCVVDAIKDLKLPSPGSYAAKVSFTL